MLRDEQVEHNSSRAAAPPETVLAAAVEHFFLAHGYRVQVELDHVDVLARHENLLVAVEVKRNLSLRVVEQAVKRQTTCDLCWVAVPRPLRGKLRPDSLTVLKRLGLGLLLVDTAGGVEVALDPGKRPQIIQSRARARLLRESVARLGHFNTAGSPGGARVTAYRQQALRVAIVLNEQPGLAPRVVNEQLPPIGISASAILQRNVYGWFHREARARYRLSEAGVAALREWKAVVDYLGAVAHSTPDGPE